MAKRASRRKPRKRMMTLQQARDRLSRSEELLGKWMSELRLAMTKMEKYRRSVLYYRKRVELLTDRQLEELREQRPQRRIDLPED